MTAKNIKVILACCVLILLNFSPACLAQELFDQGDRILLLAPHPDDEVIGTAGIIQRALKAGAKVKVACFTNGENNELAFIVYEKRITFRKKEFLYMGGVRAKETEKAAKYLGLKAEDVIFLGYPDFGTMEILTKYWGDTRPFKSLFARVNKVSYPEAFSPGAPFVGESILADLNKVILDYKPTKIFVSHPSDTNRDHQSLYVFTKITLLDLEGKFPQPQVYPYIIHVVGWPKPRGHHLELELDPPLKLSGLAWFKFFLTEEEEKAKQKAVDFFTSQIEYNPPYLYSFARKNELFADYPPIRLSRQAQGEVAWTALEADLDFLDEDTPLDQQANHKDALLSNLSYAWQDDNLLLKLDLKRKFARGRGVSLTLLGYNKDKPFAQMPKIQIALGILGKRIKDKRQVITIKNFKMYYDSGSLIFKIPLASLGNPRQIFAKVRTNAANFPVYAWSWRMIELE